METTRPCGCKGIRTCLICEVEFNISKPDLAARFKKECGYVYCPFCNKCWPGWDLNLYKEHPNHKGDPIEFQGVFIQLDFLTSNEASSLLSALDELPWELSQSGRRKQNFGPKCNFKKQRLRLGTFNGFPKSTEFVQRKFSDIPLLSDFRTVEQCTLEYNPDRGASIDPHIDDCWIWGERIVTVNVTSDSVLTMTPYRGPTSRYNLQNVRDYSDAIKGQTRWLESLINVETVNEEAKDEDLVVRIPMPARSLLVLFGAARYKWEHAVLREDVPSRRVCLAYRELTPPYLPGGAHSAEALQVLKNATIFC